jgi:hypothetical protein
MRRSTAGYDPYSSFVASLAPLDKRCELGPNELRVNPAAEATIGAGDHVLAPDHPGEVEDAVGDDLRVLDDIGGVDRRASGEGTIGHQAEEGWMSFEPISLLLS